MMARLNEGRDNPRPTIWKQGWRKLTRLWRSDTTLNVDDELRFHFEQKVAEFVGQGMSEGEARLRADEEFGDVASVRESLRQIDDRVALKHRRAEWWESVAQDLRYVVRSLSRKPLFALTVIGTLALGVGANAAIFSVLDRLYLQPPPAVRDANLATRLYHRFTQRSGFTTRRQFAHAEVRAVRERAPGGVTVASYSVGKPRLGRDGASPEVSAAYVEGDYFNVASVRPVLGRFFRPDEYRIEGTALVAVISHGVWQRHFDADPDIVGKFIDLGAHRHEIVGVAEPAFQGFDLDVQDVWVPMNTTGNLKARPADWFEGRNSLGNNIVARYPDEPTAKLFETRAAEGIRAIGIVLDTAAITLRGSLTGTLDSQGQSGELAISTRLGGVAFVILLIACANVINLLLSRSSEREREIAVRLALGVSRRRLIGQLLMESVVLALISGAVAVFIAHAGGSALRGILLPDIAWGTPILNARLVALTIVGAVSVGFVVGLIPALQFSRPNLSDALKAGRGRGTARHWLRSGSLVAQTGLSVLLLAAAGMFVSSMQSVEMIDVGFDVDRLMFARVEHDREIENHSQEVVQGMPALADRLRRTPGVESVALAAGIPMYGFSMDDLFLPGRDSLPSSNGAERTMSAVDPGYFRTVGIQIVRGRDFSTGDRNGGEPVAAVSELLARNLWPNEDALTKCIIVAKRTNACRRVVAIVSGTHFNEVIEEGAMQFYLPLAQAAPQYTPQVVAVRLNDAGMSNPGRVRAQLESQIRAEFAAWARPRIRPMPEILERQLRPWRMGAALFGAAGILALLVAAVGVYSSIAYTMAQRTREIGVRVALGARMDQIIRLVVGEGVRIVAVGAALGIVGVLMLGKLVSAMLYETSPRDPVVLVASTLTLLLVAVVACAIPAWRAGRVDPLTALRAE
ncbi:MAG: ABC transporter permease [Phycisphaerae bacterium]|nr:ABC transporter permease [Gemmatimonadaceae bacterium]